MLRKLLLSTFIAGLGLNSLSLQAEDAAPTPPAVAMPDDRGVSKMRGILNALEKKESKAVEVQRAKNGAWYVLLPNGVELIAFEKRNAPVATIQAWIRTGAVDEQEWLGSGLSHFCEHLMFKGTQKRPTGFLDQEIRGAGGDDNAYTSNDRTVYHVTTDAKNWNKSFDVVADMVMNSSFPAEEVKKEHGVVRKEIEMSIDNPDSALWDTFSRTVFQQHPYRVPVLGYPEKFDRIGREEVWAYYQRRYGPQMTTFVVVGDFDAFKAIPEMADTVGEWKRTSVNPPTIPVEPEQVAPRETSITHPLCQVPKLYLGYPSVSLRHPDLYALDVLSSILGDGRSSRLYRTVQDQKKIAQDISAFDYTPKYPGFIAVSASVDAATAPQAKQAILDVLEQSRATLPTDEELERAKRKVQARKVYSEMTAEGIAESLGSGWFDAGDLDYSQTYVDGIKTVTAKDVLRVAQQYLDPKKLNTTLLLPVDAAKQIAEKATVKAPAKIENALFENMPKDWLDAQGVAEIKKITVDTATVYRVKFTNGMRVLLKPDTSLPAVYASFTVLGGQRWEPAESAGAGNLLAEMLDRGTKQKDKTKIAQLTENIGADLSTFGGRNSFGLTSHGLKDDLGTLIALSAECLTQPNFNPEEFEAAKQQVLIEIAGQDEDIGSINSKLARSLLYGKHPYSRPVKGTKESVEKIKIDEVARLHAQWMRPENLAVGFSGDLDPKQTVEQVAQAFKGWTAATGFSKPETPLEALNGPLKGEKKVAGAEGVTVSLMFRGSKLLDEDRETLDVIGGLLSGLGGRLSIVVREQLGIAYAVGVSNDSQLDGGSVNFFIQTDPKQIEKSQEVFWTEIKKLQDAPVTDKELATVKTYLAGTEQIGLQDQADLAQKLAVSELYGEPIDRVFKRADRFSRVTPQMVQAAAKKYLDAKNSVLAIVKPDEEAKK